MRSTFFLALFLAASLQTFSQTAATAPEGLPNDPRAIFAAAAPYYDFSDPALKPWHLKATYQLYDDKGNPTEQGTYEYWWASPQLYRSTWTRSDATYTYWHTADGKHGYQSTGKRLNFFEYKLENAMVSPLPDSSDLDPAKVSLNRRMVSSGGVEYPCIMVIPSVPQHYQIKDLPLGLFPTYCFDPELPVLRTLSSYGGVNTVFNNIVGTQNKHLAREILFYEGQKKILSATVDTIEGLALSDAALAPPPDVQMVNIDKVNLDSGVASGHLIKKPIPIYPPDAAYAHLTGTVVLDATIGADGHVHDLRVISTPWPSLVASAMWAVSKWEYTPYKLNGQPVDVETKINVIFLMHE